MALMRLFTALDLPAEVVGNLEELVRRLRPVARIQWSPPANLHITTRFIGEWPEERLAELKDALAGLPVRPAIVVSVRELGFFPHPRAPRIFWCGIQAPGLEALAQDTDEAIGRLGLARQDRGFSPHLTLARIKDRPDLRPLEEAIAVLPGRDFGRFQASRFFLYRSELRPGGSVYTKLAEFPFSS